MTSFTSTMQQSPRAASIRGVFALAALAALGALLAVVFALLLL